MKAIVKIFEPLSEGRHAVILRGRDLADLTVNEQGQLTPLLEEIRKEALKRELIVLQYGKAQGMIADLSLLNSQEREDVTKILHQYSLFGNNERNITSNGEDEFSKIIRGILKLVQADNYPKFRDGRSMGFMVIIEYAEHHAPNLQPGTHTPDQVVAIELALKLSKSLGLRKSGCYVIFNEARQESLDNLLNKNLTVLSLTQPDSNEKQNVLTACRKRYPNATVESGLTDEVILNLSKNTPNRSLEQLFLASEKTGITIIARNIFLKKQEDILAMSEGTLEPIDFDKIKGQVLVGRNIARPVEILSKLADLLKKGERTALRNCLLAGAPSTGKTQLAIDVASQANIPGFLINSPKSQYVGETERKAKLMLSHLRQQGGIGLIDELELILPMNRGMQNSDSGVSQNLMGQLQTFLSDSSLSGKVALIATSNKPQDISDGMRSRWVIIPVLQPLEEDYPEIVLHIAKGIDSSFATSNNNDLTQAAKRFFSCGATPREIREAIIASMAIVEPPLSMEHIIYASNDVIPSYQRDSYIYSDLVAIQFCRNNSFLPWWDIKNNKSDPSYPYPGYILDIMDERNNIDTAKLNARINELKPYSNV